MREHYEFQTEGVCAKLITFDIEDGRIYSLNFLGGCSGNLKAIARLVEGSDAAITAGILRGNTCGHRMTSCADQLAQALEQAVSHNAENRIAS